MGKISVPLYLTPLTHVTAVSYIIYNSSRSWISVKNFRFCKIFSVPRSQYDFIFSLKEYLIKTNI